MAVDMCLQGHVLWEQDVGNKLDKMCIDRSLEFRNLEMKFEQRLLNETMRKFGNVMVIRPKTVLANLWAAGLYSNFPQLHVASQQASIIQPALGYSLMGRSCCSDKHSLKLI
jgi:hypothetical protein